MRGEAVNMFSNRINLINEISSLLSKRRDVKFAYLFGSRALGYGRLDSDVDLAVLLCCSLSHLRPP
jgi:predicted nucleotidyltransferase